ncbi:protein-L-isoaspartate O-methyltransferase family protein [Streptomyces bluensis]|uniref:protein-L-isoaspartate O-methyltransferase family protein n=1 Tax=Streptomyces bluensis TaxID=33897 RepID=UPI001679D242|nr:protein-L-isoaspartate O-methyltransferase [Streptomyces bluensis]GGZ93038.1 protein-L-isoaspartate O-methyltransferase [Streptomyces bluensis]
MPEPAPPASLTTAPLTAAAVDDADAATARAAMVARLHAAGHLSPGPVSEALLALPRQALMPQAYVRRSSPDETPPRWDLLDWSVPEDRDELLRVLYSGDSVAVQHDGEPLLGRSRGTRTGGAMTSMSSVMGMTAELLQELDLEPGQRVLDIGTGTAVTAAVACFVSSDARVVTIDIDYHVTSAAAAHLADLGYRPTVVTGDGEAGWLDRAPYDRMLISFAVPRVPRALVEQLAPQGLLLATVGTSSPSWPGLAVITKTAQGRVEGELRAVEFGHRAGWGRDRLFLSAAFRAQMATAEGVTVRGHRLPPPPEARGFWLALDHLRPGLVRNFGAEHLQIGAPECGSWVRMSPNGDGMCSVTAFGPRAIWHEIEQIAARWQAAGEPDAYRIEFYADGKQWAVAGFGRNKLCWPLHDQRPLKGDPR